MPLAPYGRHYAVRRTWQGNDAPAAITVLYAALCTAPVLQTDTGATIQEPGAAEYVRVPVLLDATFVASPDGTASYEDEIVFPEVGSTAWGDIVAIALCSSADLGAGSVFAYETVPLFSPVAGRQPHVPANVLRVAMGLVG